MAISGYLCIVQARPGQHVTEMQVKDIVFALGEDCTPFIGASSVYAFGFLAPQGSAEATRDKISARVGKTVRISILELGSDMAQLGFEGQNQWQQKHRWIVESKDMPRR